MSQRQDSKKQRAPSERSFKKALADSGHSGPITDKIWKWYNPPKLTEQK